MEHLKDESADISNFERLIDQNWNERKHLVETEFDLRSEIQSLLQRKDSFAKFQEARSRERECRDALAQNTAEYETSIEGWAAEAFKIVD